MITIVVGAQFGGEGKGKVAAYLAFKERPNCACRCGGPNSSHTVVWKGQTFKLRMMPTAAVVNPEIDVYFGAGTLLHLPTLFSEMSLIKFKGRLIIDNRAGIITEEIVREQRNDSRYEKIGSTLTGTGYAIAMRCLRALPLARQFKELSKYLADVSEFVAEVETKGGSVLIEGHQGFGLSNYHGDYPYTSSRDSTSSSMLAEIGLGPRQRDLRVVLATKMFPTRNHAGELGDELLPTQITALGIAEEGGGAWDLPNRPRRVGRLDVGIVKRAITANSATEIALTGADYLYKKAASRSKLDETTKELYSFVKSLEKATGVSVRYVSTGPDTEHMIDMTAAAGRADTVKRPDSNSTSKPRWTLDNPFIH